MDIVPAKEIKKANETNIAINEIDALLYDKSYKSLSKYLIVSSSK